MSNAFLPFWLPHPFSKEPKTFLESETQTVSKSSRQCLCKGSSIARSLDSCLESQKLHFLTSYAFEQLKLSSAKSRHRKQCSLQTSKQLRYCLTTQRLLHSSLKFHISSNQTRKKSMHREGFPHLQMDTNFDITALQINASSYTTHKGQ